MTDVLDEIKEAHSFLRDPVLGKAIDEIEVQRHRVMLMLDVIGALEDRIGDLRGYLMDIEGLSPREDEDAHLIAGQGLRNDDDSKAGTAELKHLASI
jgi:hypothetical protein